MLRPVDCADLCVRRSKLEIDDMPRHESARSFELSTLIEVNMPSSAFRGDPDFLRFEISKHRSVLYFRKVLSRFPLSLKSIVKALTSDAHCKTQIVSCRSPKPFFRKSLARIQLPYLYRTLLDEPYQTVTEIESDPGTFPEFSSNRA